MRLAHVRRQSLNLLREGDAVVGQVGKHHLLEQVRPVVRRHKSGVDGFHDAVQPVHESEERELARTTVVEHPHMAVDHGVLAVVQFEHERGHEIRRPIPQGDLGEHIRLGRHDVHVGHLTLQGFDILGGDESGGEALLNAPPSEHQIVDQTTVELAADLNDSAWNLEGVEQRVRDGVKRGGHDLLQVRGWKTSCFLARLFKIS